MRATILIMCGKKATENMSEMYAAFKKRGKNGDLYFLLTLAVYWL